MTKRRNKNTLVSIRYILTGFGCELHETLEQNQIDIFGEHLFPFLKDIGQQVRWAFIRCTVHECVERSEQFVHGSCKYSDFRFSVAVTTLRHSKSPGADRNSDEIPLIAVHIGSEVFHNICEEIDNFRRMQHVC